ncbi:hypothetical protein GQ53DRAFT_758676 [Thozetella sp. PMI_491]|nr:hypothetical protein GQ53DRAFT_758676 [Thozetella sp. PMI_491]
MGDSDESRAPAAGIPAWQQPQPPAENDSSSKASSDTPEQATLEQARKFLQDEEVQKSSRDRKVEFLKSKGIAQDDIDKLLLEEEPQKAAEAPAKRELPKVAPQSPETPLPPAPPPAEDRAPVITYPEFLVKPQRPPPLVTVNGFLDTLKVFGAVSAVIYGTSKYVLEPMVERLTEARIELHETTNANLAKLVEKLEATVSEVPEPKRTDVPTRAGGRDEDDSSSYDDPTELFHRDIGVQTSRPPSPTEYRNLSNGRIEPPPRPTAAERLANLVKSVRVVKEGYVKETQEYDSTKVILDDFSREMTTMAYPHNDYVFGYNSYGGASSNEPDDEIKQAKENIRRVKGVLLSTKSFPMGSVR